MAKVAKTYLTSSPQGAVGISIMAIVQKFWDGGWEIHLFSL